MGAKKHMGAIDGKPRNLKGNEKQPVNKYRCAGLKNNCDEIPKGAHSLGAPCIPINGVVLDAGRPCALHVGMRCYNKTEIRIAPI